MSLRQDYERGINDPKAPQMPWWFEYAPLLFGVLAIVVIVVGVALGAR